VENREMDILIWKDGPGGVCFLLMMAIMFYEKIEMFNQRGWTDQSNQ
jgi:hypothetical protein